MAVGRKGGGKERRRGKEREGKERREKELGKEGRERGKEGKGAKEERREGGRKGKEREEKEERREGGERKGKEGREGKEGKGNLSNDNQTIEDDSTFFDIISTKDFRGSPITDEIEKGNHLYDVRSLSEFFRFGPGLASVFRGIYFIKSSFTNQSKLPG